VRVLLGGGTSPAAFLASVDRISPQRRGTATMTRK